MIHIREVTSTSLALLPGLCELLQDSVNGGASIGFLEPVTLTTARAYWREVMGGLGPSLRLWVAEEGGELAGTVQIAPCIKENGRHRAELQKLLVHSRFRRRGIGAALLEAAQRAASGSGISLLVLDTLRDSVAESIYGRLGWVRVGEIPAYAASPDGELHPTVLFYKALDC